MKVILIDYSILTLDELRDICKDLGLDYKKMSLEKKKSKITKVFIDIDSFSLIAYVNRKDPTRVVFVDNVDGYFKSIEPCRPKVTYTQAPVLELDTILEKIHKKGIESLLKEEKDFLDKLSQS